MRRNHISCLWIVLLCLLPILTDAQTLSRYEYWFDDDIGSKQWGSLSGTDNEVDLAIDATHLDNGIHKFSFRVRQSDGMYSAIRSSIFLKTTPGEATRLEYWIDGDISTRKLFDGQRISDGDYIINDSLDLSDVSPGVHRLFLRGRGPNTKVVSAVTSVPIFVKQTMPQGNKVVYWIDDNYDQKESVGFDSSLDVNSLNLDMADNTKYPVGYHRLNMRVDLEGQGESAVFTDGFFKSPTGQATQLEYWIDGDIRTRKLFDGQSVSGGDYIINDFLDLSDVSPGVHRVFLRGRGPNTKVVSAVTSTPIMVKSRYNVDPADVKVMDQAYWFDDEEPTVSSVDNPKNVINQPNTFDTRHLTDGQHTLHVQFGNSAGVWNGPVDYIFEKTPVVDPSIEASATVEDGIVTLNYTAIPFALSYEVVRKYPSGHKRLVNFNESSEYPAPFRAIDTPGIGTYTYYIEGNYIDLNGVKQEVRSDEMTVTVEEAASTVEQAKIYGEVRHDGVPIYAWGDSYKVYINGTDARETEYDFYKSGANFSIGGVPYGTELTISVRERDYGHKDITLITSKNTNDITYKFDGIYGEVEEQLANEAYDVILTNSIHLTPDAWELSVHNKMRFHTWSGDIIVKLIRKATLDLYTEEANGGVPIWKYLKNKKLGVDDGPNYKTVAKMHVHLEKDEYRTIALDLIDMPASDLKEDYYVCIYTKQDGSDQMKELGGGYENPQTVNFNPCDYLTQNDLDLYLVNEYKQVMSYLKQMSQWGDPFAFEINSIPGDNLNEIINNLGNGRYFDVEGFEEDLVVNGSHSAGLLLSCFLGDVVKDVKRYAKNTRGSLKIADGIQEVFNTLRDFYQINEVDENLKFFETFKQVIKVGEKLKLNEKMWGFKYPAFEIYKTYFDVAEAMVKAIDKIEISVQEAALYEKLINGKGIYKIKVRRYTTDGRVEYFPASEVYDQIREIKFQMTTEYQEGYHPETSKFQIDSPKLSDEITISNVDFDYLHNNISTGIQLWMIITWRNNRVTRVPMLEKHFAKLENFKSDTEPPTMTVELQSETYLRKDYMANKLTIINQK